MPPISQAITTRQVFGTEDDTAFLPELDWGVPVQFFVGRNGSGKSRTAKALAQASGVGTRLLASDRLLGLMAVTNYGYGVGLGTTKGAPLADSEAGTMRNVALQQGLANDVLYILRERPDVYLRLAALFRRAFRRKLYLAERDGFLDPVMEDSAGHAFSLLRDEGHGLRELTVLLTVTYEEGRDLLIFDEPELHLHPSLARFWLQELCSECERTGKRAVVVTHSPDLIRPTSVAELDGIWIFSPFNRPKNLAAFIEGDERDTIDGSLKSNPQLVSALVFSPRPVLVEGPADAAALEAASRRLFPREVQAQTDFIPCWGSPSVAAWFAVGRRLGLDPRAVADLDALFDRFFARSMNQCDLVQDAYRTRLHVQPPRTDEALRPVYDAGIAKGSPDSREKAKRLASMSSSDASLTAARLRRDAVLDIWKQAGVWLHPQGTLEDVLGTAAKATAEAARESGGLGGAIDDVVRFSAFEFDTRADIRALLQGEGERIAQAIQRELGLDPTSEFRAPAGPSRDADSRLVSVESLGRGKHRLTVVSPEEFAGWFVEFDRSASPPNLELQQPPAE